MSARILVIIGVVKQFVVAALACALAGCPQREGPVDARSDAADDALADAVSDASVDGGGDALDAPDVRVVSACDTATEATLTTVAMLETGRYSPVGITLADGHALIAGGYDFRTGIQAGTELFDLASNALVPSGALIAARNFPATTRLLDGQVLVVGGFDPTTGSLVEGEIYDPTAGEFHMLDAVMSIGREAHSATLLHDGRVLIVGGLQARGFRFHLTAEVFDPMAGSFARVSPMSTARAFHAAVALASGRAVLVVGGDSGHGELASAERFDADSGTWSATANSRVHAAKALAAVALDDGRVLVAGGANATDNTLTDADLYDPAADRFTPTGPMHTRRMAHTLTMLSDGRVLAVGGWSDSTSPQASAASLEVYDPRTGTWELLPVRLARPRHDHVALLLPDCRVLIAGGQQVTNGVPAVAPREVEVLTIPRRR